VTSVHAQRGVIAFFQDALGYAYLGHWKDREGNRNVEQALLTDWIELAKKPVSCLEYIFVYEMTHFLERHHTDRFHELMDGLLPSWRLCKDELNRAPLAHEEWTC